MTTNAKILWYQSSLVVCLTACGGQVPQAIEGKLNKGYELQDTAGEVPPSPYNLCAEKSKYHTISQSFAESFAYLCQGEQYSPLFETAKNAALNATGPHRALYESKEKNGNTIEYRFVNAMKIPVSVDELVQEVGPAAILTDKNWTSGGISLQQRATLKGSLPSREAGHIGGTSYHLNQVSSTWMGASSYDFAMNVYRADPSQGAITLEEVTAPDFGTQKKSIATFALPIDEYNTLVVSAMHFVQGTRGFNSIVARGTEIGINTNVNVYYQTGLLVASKRKPKISM